jgi:hypothetical protein
MTSLTLGELPLLDASCDEDDDETDQINFVDIKNKDVDGKSTVTFLNPQISGYSEPEKETEPEKTCIQEHVSDKTDLSAADSAMQAQVGAMSCHGQGFSLAAALPPAMWMMQVAPYNWPTHSMANGNADPERLAKAAVKAANGKPGQSFTWNNVYTVMMKNLPNRITQETLLIEVNDAGFLGMYDFLYLPIDPDTKTNRGYAFINFITPSFALMFGTHFEGYRFNNFKSHKVVSVVPAVVQGYNANYAHYSKARLRQLSPSERPVFLRGPNASGRSHEHRMKPISLIDMAKRRQEDQKRAGASRSGANCEIEVSSAIREEISNIGVEGNVVGCSSDTRVAKFCPFCGGKLQATFKFCEFCGKQLPFAKAADSEES